MTPIPTAEQFLHKKGIYSFMVKDNTWDKILQASIEFAKLHAKTALKRASKKADYTINGQFGAYQKISINRKEIRNAYPESNVK